jgi:hypothetical protein
MTIATFQEYELDEGIFTTTGVVLGARIIFTGLVRAGVNAGKLLLPAYSIRTAIQSTVVGAIAVKYNLTTVIKTQAAGTELVMALAASAGKKISAELAASIFAKAMIGGGVTLGAILLTLVVPKSRRKVFSIFKRKGKKKKLNKSDIKLIGKEIRKKKK